MTSSSSSTAEPGDARRFDGLLLTPPGGGFSALGDGLLPDREARRRRLGGEIVCEVW